MIGRRGFLGALLAAPVFARFAPRSVVEETQATTVLRLPFPHGLHHVVATVNHGEPIHMRIECGSEREALDAVRRMYHDATDLSASLHNNPLNGFSWTTWPKAGA